MSIHAIANKHWILGVHAFYSKAIEHPNDTIVPRVSVEVDGTGKNLHCQRKRAPSPLGGWTQQSPLDGHRNENSLKNIETSALLCILSKLYAMNKIFVTNFSGLGSNEKPQRPCTSCIGHLRDFLPNWTHKQTAPIILALLLRLPTTVAFYSHNSCLIA